MRYVYPFFEGEANIELLGGKGAGLVEMTRLGLPVPPGFTITTEACRRYLDSGDVPDGMWEEVAAATGAPVEVHCGRAEALLDLKADVVTARALAPLDKLLELAFPFFRDGTIGLFLKGKSLPAELTLATKSWKLDSTPVPSRSDPSGSVLRVTGLTPWRKPKKPS